MKHFTTRIELSNEDYHIYHTDTIERAWMGVRRTHALLAPDTYITKVSILEDKEEG